MNGYDWKSYYHVCPECGQLIYSEPTFVPPELRNAAQLAWMMKAAQKAFWPTQLDRMRGMDDEELIVCIMTIAEQEYVRGFFHKPSIVGNLRERLLERSGMVDEGKQTQPASESPFQNNNGNGPKRI